MQRRAIAGLAAALCIAASALALSSCGSVEDAGPDSATDLDPDGADLAAADSAPSSDATEDFDASDADGPLPPAQGRDQLSQSAGGGMVSSSSFRATVHIGTPSPMGTTSSASHRVRLGPGQR